MAKSHDEKSMTLAEDLVSIDHYRVGARKGEKMVFVTIGEVDPHCDDLVSDDLAKYTTPEEAETARDQYTLVNRAVGLLTEAVVVGVNAAGVIMAVDGETVMIPYEEDGSDIPF